MKLLRHQNNIFCPKILHISFQECPFNIYLKSVEKLKIHIRFQTLEVPPSRGGGQVGEKNSGPYGGEGGNSPSPLVTRMPEPQDRGHTVTAKYLSPHCFRSSYLHCSLDGRIVAPPQLQTPWLPGDFHKLQCTVGMYQPNQPACL